MYNTFNIKILIKKKKKDIFIHILINSNMYIKNKFL